MDQQHSFAVYVDGDLLAGATLPPRPAHVSLAQMQAEPPRPVAPQQLVTRVQSLLGLPSAAVARVRVAFFTSTANDHPSLAAHKDAVRKALKQASFQVDVSDCDDSVSVDAAVTARALKVLYKQRDVAHHVFVTHSPDVTKAMEVIDDDGKSAYVCTLGTAQPAGDARNVARGVAALSDPSDTIGLAYQAVSTPVKPVRVTEAAAGPAKGPSPAPQQAAGSSGYAGAQQQLQAAPAAAAAAVAAAAASVSSSVMAAYQQPPLKDDPIMGGLPSGDNANNNNSRPASERPAESPVASSAPVVTSGGSVASAQQPQQQSSPAASDAYTYSAAAEPQQGGAGRDEDRLAGDAARKSAPDQADPTGELSAPQPQQSQQPLPQPPAPAADRPEAPKDLPPGVQAHWNKEHFAFYYVTSAPGQPPSSSWYHPGSRLRHLETTVSVLEWKQTQPELHAKATEQLVNVRRQLADLKRQEEQPASPPQQPPQQQPQPQQCPAQAQQSHYPQPSVVSSYQGTPVGDKNYQQPQTVPVPQQQQQAAPYSYQPSGTSSAYPAVPQPQQSQATPYSPSPYNPQQGGQVPQQPTRPRSEKREVPDPTLPQGWRKFVTSAGKETFVDYNTTPPTETAMRPPTV